MLKWIRENRNFLLLLGLFGLFRTAIADWNPIPSGSMRPNLLEGDVVLVNRLAYQLKLPLTDVVLARTGEPQRGEVVTFSSPKDGTRLIKRIIALPGDTLEMRNKELWINGKKASYTLLETHQEQPDPNQGMRVPAATLRESLPDMLPAHPVQWLAARGGPENFGPLTVPADHYLMFGDNRDNSADSRYFGLVPREKIIGRAERILVSADILDYWQPRLGRFGRSLAPGASDQP